MSKIARWSYKNTAMVQPFIVADEYGKNTYGEPYQIKCTWQAMSQAATTPAGVEFVSRHVIYCEDARPKYLDLIQLNGQTEWEEIRAYGMDDMSMFNDTPDYKLTTG